MRGVSTDARPPGTEGNDSGCGDDGPRRFRICTSKCQSWVDCACTRKGAVWSAREYSHFLDPLTAMGSIRPPKSS
jgi:hypothetical protein